MRVSWCELEMRGRISSLHPRNARLGKRVALSRLAQPLESAPIDCGNPNLASPSIGPECALEADSPGTFPLSLPTETQELAHVPKNIPGPARMLLISPIFISKAPAIICPSFRNRQIGSRPIAWASAHTKAARFKQTRRLGSLRSPHFAFEPSKP